MPSRSVSDPGWDRESSSAETNYGILAVAFIAIVVVFVVLLAFLYPQFQTFSQSLGSGQGATGLLVVDIFLIGGPIVVLLVATYIVLRASSRSGSEALSELPEADYFEDEKGR
jgi:hypothetical protein